MRRIHYGWIIVLCGILITGVSGGMAVNCFSLFIVPINEDLGFTRGQLGLCQTINALGFLAVSLGSGWFFRRIKLIYIMRIAAVLQTAVFFLYAQASELWMLYVLSAVNSLCAASLTWIPFSIILNNWFLKKRALAIGIAFMGSGIGGMIASAVGGPLIVWFGWRATFMVFACALAVVLLPIMYLVLYVSPEDAGKAPYGAGKQMETTVSLSGDGAILKEEIRNTRFYRIALCLFAFGFASNGYTGTFLPHMQDVGYTEVTASTLYSMYMLILAVGKVLMGAIFDKIGTWKTTLLGIVTMALTLTGLIFCKIPLFIAVMLLASGVGNCYTTVGIPVMTRTVYGMREYAAFTGIMNVACNIGSTLAPSVLGFVRDFTGAYTPGYAVILAVLVVSGALMLTALPTDSALRHKNG